MINSQIKKLFYFNKIISLHLSYLLSKKTVVIGLILIGLSIITFIYFTDYYIDQFIIFKDKEYYKEEYLYEGINFIKLIIVVFSIFITIESFIVLKYDYFLLSRISKAEYILTKISSLLMLASFLGGYLVIIMWIIGMSIPVYFFPSDISVLLLTDIILFAIYYTLLSIFIVLHTNNLFSLAIILIGYFISSMTIDYLSIKTEVNSFSYFIQLIFIDYTVYLDTGYSFLYSKYIILSIFIVIFIFSYKKYLEKDI